MPAALELDKVKSELVEQFIESDLNEFQKFQLNLGISSGGFGLHSQAHTCISANLASSIEYARFKLKTIQEATNNPRGWLKQIFEAGSHQTSYIRDIIQEALNFKRKYRDPTLKSSPFFWTSSEERQPNGPPTREAESDEDWLVRILFREQSPLQHGIYQCLFEITANGHVTQFLDDEQISNADKARFRSGAFEHAGKWLATIPREGFWMSTGEFRTAMQLQWCPKLERLQNWNQR